MAGVSGGGWSITFVDLSGTECNHCKRGVLEDFNCTVADKGSVGSSDGDEDIVDAARENFEDSSAVVRDSWEEKNDCGFRCEKTSSGIVDKVSGDSVDSDDDVKSISVVFE